MNGCGWSITLYECGARRRCGRIWMCRGCEWQSRCNAAGRSGQGCDDEGRGKNSSVGCSSWFELLRVRGRGAVREGDQAVHRRGGGSRWMNDKRIEDAGTLVRSQSQSEYSAVVIRVSSAARTVNRWYSTRTRQHQQFISSVHCEDWNRDRARRRGSTKDDTYTSVSACTCRCLGLQRVVAKPLRFVAMASVTSREAVVFASCCACERAQFDTPGP
jgi:hypothetical protein